MIVATAGHIDHGKTTLVRTLTGVDTDRLPEEKARGISIELGFAYWTLDDGTVIGFVDVPGHERFVRTMLAGVCGIDFVMLVVAADDGVMPQTVEHFRIIQLLGIDKGVVVVTKVDCAPRGRIDDVVREIRSLLAGTALDGAPVFRVSAATGEGVADLTHALQAAAKAHAVRAREGQFFRMAIDRAFTLAGSGTVVTGTIFNGVVAAGDRVMVSPAGVEVRVRAIQIRGGAVDRAVAGSRCAINLAGIDVEHVARGDWLLERNIHAPTDHIDAKLLLLEDASKPIDRPVLVHLHLGTGDVIARVASRRGAPIVPGQWSVVRLRPQRPIVALHGDRFIIRDPSARKTLGGGIVLDPAPSLARRDHTTRDAVIAALDDTDGKRALARLLAVSRYAVDAAWFERIFDLVPARAAAMYRELDAVVLGRERRAVLSASAASQLREAIVDRLQEFHRAQPRDTGIPVASLRKALAPYVPLDAFAALLAGMVEVGNVEVSRSEVRLAGRSFTLSQSEQALWERMVPVLIGAGAAPPSVEQVAAGLDVAPRVALDLLHRLRKAGEVFQTTPSRFYPAPTIAALAATAAQLTAAQPDRAFTVGQFRDAIGTGRSVAMEILDLLDRIGVTLRVGDLRRMQARYLDVVGASAPFRPPPAKPAATGRSPHDPRPRTAR